MRGTDGFFFDAIRKPNSVTVKVKTRHEGTIASFEEETNKFQVLIQNEAIDLEWSFRGFPEKEEKNTIEV